MQLCVHSNYFLQTRMDFPSPRAKAAFLICFTLDFERTSFERKTTEYFVSGFYQNFLPLVKRVHTFNLAKPFLFSYLDFFNFFVMTHSKVRPGFVNTFIFKTNSNLLGCFMFFPNDNIYFCCVNVV